MNDDEAQVDAIVRRRVWRRNLPLILGIAATYLLFMPAIRAAAVAGTIRPGQSLPYLGYGLLVLASGLFLATRFWRFRWGAQPSRRWARALFFLADLLIWLVTGFGFGLLLLAALNLLFWLF